MTVVVRTLAAGRLRDDPGWGGVIQGCSDGGDGNLKVGAGPARRAPPRSSGSTGSEGGSGYSRTRGGEGRHGSNRGNRRPGAASD